MKPRYIVSSVTGFSINTTLTTSGRPRTIWSVLDSANCYLPVSVLDHGLSYDERGEDTAHQLARKLNALDLLGPAPPPALCAGNGHA